MKRRAGVRRRFQEQFLLDESKLRKIAEVMREHANRLDPKPELNFDLFRSDNSFYETADVEIVLQEDNSQEKAISELFIELLATDEPDAETTDLRPLAQVKFSLTAENTVDLLVRHDNRDWSFLLADDLEGQIKRCAGKKPFVARWRHPDLIALAFLAIVALIGFTWGSPELPGLPPSKELVDANDATLLKALVAYTRASSETGTRLLWILFGVMGLLVTVIMIAELRPFASLSKRLMRSVFYWGDAQVDYDRRVKSLSRIKWGIGIAFVVSAVASLVTALALR